jgi:hypothetical protein
VLIQDQLEYAKASIPPCPKGMRNSLILIFPFLSPFHFCGTKRTNSNCNYVKKQEWEARATSFPVLT